MPTVQKIILSIFLALVLVSSSLSPFFASSAHAQTTWYNQDFGDWYLKVYDTTTSPASDVFGERYTSAQLQWIFYGLTGQFINAVAGGIGAKPSDIACVIRQQKSLLSQVAQHAPLPLKQLIENVNLIKILTTCGFSGIIDRIKNPLSEETSKRNSAVADYIFSTDRPLSGISYFRNVARNLKIIPEAKAQTQGFGFGALDPVLPLWKASRDVAYALLIFVILIMSFMVMFRVKLNPQTVITVQSAIPKIVMALILVTFSYAIAGLLVDFMYVVLGLLSLVFSKAWAIYDAPTFFGLMTTGPVGLGIFGVLTVYFLPITILLALALLIAVGLIFSGAGTPVGIVIVGLIIVIMVAMFIFFVKILWMLFKAFAYIILLVAFAPFLLVLGVIMPSVGFGQWVRSMLSNLAVFVVANVLLFLTAFLALAPIINPPPNQSSTAGWPPLLNIGNGNFPISLVYLGVSVALFALIPKVADIISSVISGKPLAYGAAIGEAIGPIKGVAQFGAGAAERGLAGYFGQEFQTILGRARPTTVETGAGKVTKERMPE